MDQLIRVIEQIMKTGDERYRDKLYLAADSCEDGTIDLPFALGLWNGLLKLEECPTDKLIAVYQAWVPEYKPSGLRAKSELRTDGAEKDEEFTFGEDFDSVIDAELKKKFLGEVRYDWHRHKRACKLFVDISRYEKKLNKDVSLFGKEEALAMIREQKFDKKTQVSEFIGVISRYSKWRSVNGFPVGKAFAGKNRIIPKEIEDEIVSEEFIYNPSELVARIRKEAVNPYDMGGVIFCLSWLGFSFEEMLQIKETDVEIFADHGTVLGKKIPDVMVPIFKDYIDTDEKTEKVGFDNVRVVKREECEFFLKRWDTRKNLGKRSSEILKNNTRELGMTHTTVWQSGALYRLYLSEKKGKEICLKDVAEEFGVKEHEKTMERLVKQKFDLYQKYKATIPKAID